MENLQKLKASGDPSEIELRTRSIIEKLDVITNLEPVDLRGKSFDLVFANPREAVSYGYLKDRRILDLDDHVVVADYVESASGGIRGGYTGYFGVFKESNKYAWQKYLTHDPDFGEDFSGYMPVCPASSTAEDPKDYDSKDSVYELVKNAYRIEAFKQLGYPELSLSLGSHGDSRDFGHDMQQRIYKGPKTGDDVAPLNDGNYLYKDMKVKNLYFTSNGWFVCDRGDEEIDVTTMAERLNLWRSISDFEEPNI